MNIAEIRQKYPQYNDLSDEDLARGFHKKFYSDMDFGEFSAKIGLTPEKDQTIANIEGGLTALDKGLNFGLAKKIGGALNAIGAAPVDALMTDKSLKDAFKDRYNEIVETADKSQAEFAERNPLTNASLEIGGAIANPANKVALGFIPKAGSFAKKVVGSGVVGGGVSALDSTINDNENALEDALTTGAVTGSLPVVGATLRGFGKAANQILGKTTGAGDKAISDAFKAGTKGDSSFLANMRNSLDVDNLEKKVEDNFNNIKRLRNRAYEEDLTRIKQQTADKPLNLKAVIDDVKTVIRDVEGDAPYLVDKETTRVFDETKDVLNKFYKDKTKHNLDGFDRLKKRIQGITTKEGTPADAIKTQITNSVKNQILKQSPDYKAVQDAYAKDSEIINDLKKVFSLNRNANSETILKKVQSTARNNANTDWGYRAELLKRLDPTGEIQDAISANALNTWTPRGGLGGIVGFGGIFARDPFLMAASSPRAIGYGAYGLGKLRNFAPQNSGRISPYLAQMLRLSNNEGN